MQLKKLFTLALLAGAALTTGTATHAQVTPERLLNTEQEPGNWLLYHGDYDGHRHSDLAQLTPANVGELELKWIWQVRSRDGAPEKFEATPLYLDGVLYTVSPPNDVVELDARTWREFWVHSHTHTQ